MTNYDHILSLFKKAIPVSKIPGTPENKTRKMLYWTSGIMLLIGVVYYLNSQSKEKDEKN